MSTHVATATMIVTSAISSVTMISSASPGSVAVGSPEWLGKPRIALRNLGRRGRGWREGELLTTHLSVVSQLSVEYEVT